MEAVTCKTHLQEKKNTKKYQTEKRTLEKRQMTQHGNKAQT